MCLYKPHCRNTPCSSGGQTKAAEEEVEGTLVSHCLLLFLTAITENAGQRKRLELILCGKHWQVLTRNVNVRGRYERGTDSVERAVATFPEIHQVVCARRLH